MLANQPYGRIRFGTNNPLWPYSVRGNSVVAKQEQKSKSDLKTEQKIDFLRYVADEHHGTLNAGVAVVRLEILLEDIQRFPT